MHTFPKYFVTDRHFTCEPQTLTKTGVTFKTFLLVSLLGLCEIQKKKNSLNKKSYKKEVDKKLQISGSFQLPVQLQIDSDLKLESWEITTAEKRRSINQIKRNHLKNGMCVDVKHMYRLDALLSYERSFKLKYRKNYKTINAFRLCLNK